VARRSASARAKLEAEKARIEAELSRYQKLISDLRMSGESMVVRTQKQREYHHKIQDLKYQMSKLDIK